MLKVKSPTTHQVSEVHAHKHTTVMAVGLPAIALGEHGILYDALVCAQKV